MRRFLNRIFLAALLVFAFGVFNTGVTLAETGAFDTRKSIPSKDKLIELAGLLHNEDKLIKLVGLGQEGSTAPVEKILSPGVFGPYQLSPGDSEHGSSELFIFPEHFDVFAMIAQGSGSTLKMEVKLSSSLDRIGDSVIFGWLVIRPGFEVVIDTTVCIAAPIDIPCILDIGPFPKDSVAVALTGLLTVSPAGPPAPYDWWIDLVP